MLDKRQIPRIVLQLDRPVDPRITALLREGVLTTEPTQPQPTGKKPSRKKFAPPIRSRGIAVVPRLPLASHRTSIVLPVPGLHQPGGIGRR
jgi:hypothetical protein